MDNDNLDMFSRLTSSLLVLIVSYLPFKEAARTSVLSKQWRNVWRETTYLEFDEKSFVNLEETDENQRIQRSFFFDFIRQFLANYPRTPIQKFSLTCSKPEGFLADIQNFVIFAISRNVKDLELDFSDPIWREEDDPKNHPAAVELPFQVYQHLGLESLKLISCNFDLSRFSNSTTLKGVSLVWVDMSLASIEILLLRFPFLESLSLKKCWNIHHVEITVPNLRLKNLVLDKCHFNRNYYYIDGPTLRFLKFSGRVGIFQLVNLTQIEEADLDFGMEPEFDDIGILLYYFLEAVCAAKVLTLCSVLLQIVPTSHEPVRLRAPLAVRHLILKTAMHPNEFYGVRFMFRNCPKLEILTFEICPAKIFPDYEPPFELNPSEFWSEEIWVQMCMKKSLKVINVKGFKGTPNELYILRYIIMCARKLRKVNFYVFDGDDLEEIWEKFCYLRQVPSSSKNLKTHIQLISMDT
ncbi:hypothetical protein MANES_03G127400v8 [Manihot esculenta]|uniref:Uncharacterized protein n=1 Tax=Manihot esculenta TaxID=3983 RepID=A0ACB7I504_MANES|nr:hypothetical protein MANES_03G127400v8 [Manihot esculenta]